MEVLFNSRTDNYPMVRKNIGDADFFITT